MKDPKITSAHGKHTLLEVSCKGDLSAVLSLMSTRIRPLKMPWQTYLKLQHLV